jgi:hypothetical protein
LFVIAQTLGELFTVSPERPVYVWHEYVRQGARVRAVWDSFDTAGADTSTLAKPLGPRDAQLVLNLTAARVVAGRIRRKEACARSLAIKQHRRAAKLAADLRDEPGEPEEDSMEFEVDAAQAEREAFEADEDAAQEEEKEEEEEDEEKVGRSRRLCAKKTLYCHCSPRCQAVVAIWLASWVRRVTWPNCASTSSGRAPSWTVASSLCSAIIHSSRPPLRVSGRSSRTL